MSPPEDNAVLSQGDIDALVTQSGSQAGPADAPAGPQADQAAASGSGGAALAELIKRIEKLEAALASLSSADGDSTKLKANVDALTKQFQGLNSSITEIRQHLGNTLGYAVRESFACPSCSAKGYVAARVVCTYCNQDTFVGWWPQT